MDLEHQPARSMDKPHHHLTISDQVDLVDFIIEEAIEKGASDIHFEPYQDKYRIRYRLDGYLKEQYTLATETATRITARLKILAQIDSSERRLPQDGRIAASYQPAQALDLRVSTCPTVYGEKIVVRILDKAANVLSIKDLAMSNRSESMFLSQLNKPQGLILVTGPTGSGKTITLYSALHYLNSPIRNISTAEDPVEITMPGINQVPIQPKIGLHFSTILRAFLRQDPDVIMLGEIRDTETAEIAAQAALTGHLVLSTLHTNSAVESITRLCDLSIPVFNIAASLRLVIAQRLVRKLCIHCKKQEGNRFIPIGCSHCHQGYKGRIGLFECLPISPFLANLLRKTTNTDMLLAQAKKEGFVTLYEEGLAKVQAGITTLDEVYRATMD